MESRMDFVEWLEPDMLRMIFMGLDDISDIVHASAVSHGWRQWVIANGLSKQHCLRLFPQLSKVSRVIEVGKCDEAKESMEVSVSSLNEWQTMEIENRVYAFLARASNSFSDRNCIADAVWASSTDNYPEESIQNTLEPRDIVERRASYWSSKGQSKSTEPETLIYKLVSNLCVITEINIRPFQAFFQLGLPIYAAKSVRFRMGHPKEPEDCTAESELFCDPSHDSVNDKFVWTYTSQVFPMTQNNNLQKFKFPEPILCMGGIVQIELLGRVQRQEMDGLYYICVAHVQVMGRSLAPALDLEIVEPSGTIVLKRNLLANLHSPEDEQRTTMPSYLERRVRALQQMVNMLRGNVFEVDEYDEDEARR